MGSQITARVKNEKKTKQTLTLDQPVTYQIKVPGVLDKRMADWVGGMTVTVGTDDNGLPVTTLVVCVDQAALQGLLRRLYSLGLPLSSVICVEIE